MWPWRVKITQPLLALGYRILPSQIKPVAEVWSIFLRQSFVKILKPILAMLWFQKRLVYLPFPNLPDIPSLRICINFHYVGKKCVFYSFSFCDSLFARLTGLTCHLYIASNILPFPARRVNKTQNFQLDNQKNMKFKTKTITTFSQERFQYLYKDCCQQWLMKKTFHRCASRMPIVRNTCSQGGRSWQPFGEGKYGHKNFRQARIYYFRN